MNTPLDNNEIFALRPPIITGSTVLRTPEHYHGGIPIRAVEGDVQVRVDPWVNMDIGDRFDMYVNNPDHAVWGEEIGQEQVNQPLIFRIARGHFVEGAAEIYYRVTRTSQATETSKPILIMLVKLQRPGGFDDNTEEGHSGLTFTLLPDLSNGVTPEIADRGVQMQIAPYENIATHDSIIARWGSQEVTYYPVTQQQIDDPVNHPILIEFTKEVIAQHGDGPDVAVTFQVIDRVGNYPDERAPWAKIQRVLVDVAGNRLRAPVIVVNGRPVTAIDLEQLGESDVTVLVYTQPADFNEGDRIRLTWTGMPSQGQPIVVEPPEQCVESVHFHYEFMIPNASVKALAKGSASVSYVRVRDEAADRPSLKASVSVRGDISRLAAPTIDEASGGTLNPDEPWATCRIPWSAGFKRSDQVTVVWEAVRPGGSTEYYSDSRSIGSHPENTPISRSVSNAVIQRFNGLRVTVYYSVANDDLMLQNVRDSLPLYVQVGITLPQFVAPQVDEAQDGTLDPERVPPAGATLTVPHRDTLAKDRVTYHWRGSASGGSTSDFVDLTSHSAGQPVKFTVAKNYVTANLNGKVVVTYTIKREGQLLGTSAELALNVGKAHAEVPPPTVVEAPDYVLDPNQYQQGFTVKFDTSKLQPEDEIELTVLGRAGDGSTMPERKRVNGQTQLDFPIVAAITGANLRNNVRLNYKTIRGGQQSPVMTQLLNIGDLLQQNMPRPGIEGFDGAELQIGSIKDDSKVRCDQWPFQPPKSPIWLSYVETRADGSSRTKDQFVAATHDQGAGLSYTAEVAWLRECKADSKVAIVLKVGLFGEATVGDAVECQVRVYSVKAGLDDLTTFTDFDWNGWTLPYEYKSQITRLAGEYFVESVRHSNGYQTVWMQKAFTVDIGKQYAFSFDYQSPVAVPLSILQNGNDVYNGWIPESDTWQAKTVSFYAGTTPTASPMILVFYLGGPTSVVKMDNLRLRKI
ncbi:Uncharacterised protein [Pseudomonas fluorescens]|uniref:Uncharacterized protein n=1 Tax=Pseudomonas fluorescens TaxID=294 RepID=A0A448DXV8_PSEFL|nr:hypothetical protein [Pseudomonas fluorescens]VEF11671.1 Uncharacterised protein [Pseudomonas fluorescens]